MAADPLVGGLLALHDLHPVPVAHAAASTRWTRRAAQARLHGVGHRAAGIDDDGMVRVVDRRRRAAASDTVRGRRRPPRSAAVAPDAAGVVVRRAAPAEPTLLQIGVRRPMTSWPLRRFLAGARRRRGAGAGAVRAVRHAGAGRAPAPRAGRRAAAAVRLRAVRVPVRQPGRRRRRVPAGARPVPRRSRLHADRRAVGRAADPGRDGVLPAQLDARGESSPATRARPGPPRASWRSTPGRTGSAASRAGRASWSPTSRRCWCAAGAGGGTDACSCPIDACYRLVGLVRLHWRGFDGGARGLGGDRRVLRRAAGAAPAGCDAA